MNKFLFILKAMVLFAIPMMSQTSFDQPTKVYLMHSSGNHLECDANGRGVLRASNSMQMMTFIPDGKGYYI